MGFAIDVLLLLCCAMRSVEPEVFLVARPKVDYEAMAAYLREVGGERWLERLDRDQLGNDAQDLAEFAGKMCYRSWEPGLNPNVRKVREDQEAYLQNILSRRTVRYLSTSASLSCCTT